MPLINGRKETDHHHQDLILFQELHKREKERNIVSLLQPLSDEFEPNGTDVISIIFLLYYSIYTYRSCACFSRLPPSSITLISLH